MAGIRFEDIRAVGEMLFRNLRSASGGSRPEFRPVNGDLFTGDLTLRQAKAPQHAPVVLRLPGAEDETTGLVESEPIRVVTVARQHGTGGEMVAQSVARQLGLRLVDHEVIRNAAIAAGVSADVIEATVHHPGLLDRALRGLALGGGAVPSMWMPPLAVRASPLFSSPVYRDFVETAIQDLAEKGHVLILGHGAQFVLRNRSDAFRILITGSVDCRARRALAEGLSWAEALQTIRKADEERVAYFNQFYGAGWLDPGTYDLVVNTDRTDAETAAAFIVEAVRSRAGRRPIGAMMLDDRRKPTESQEKGKPT